MPRPTTPLLAAPSRTSAGQQSAVPHGHWTLRPRGQAPCRTALRAKHASWFEILGGLPLGPVTAFPTLAKSFPALAIWLTVLKVRVGRVKRHFFKQLRRLRKGENPEEVDFDLNVLPPTVPKRNGDLPSPTWRVWRKTIYWAKVYNKSRYGTSDRFAATQAGEERVAVLGGGAFGTAMAAHVARKGYPTTVLVRDKLVRDFINKKHVNPRYLSDYDLPHELTATTQPAKALEGCTAIVHAMPVQASRKALEAMKDFVPLGVPLISVSKGVELESRELMCGVIPDALGRSDDVNPLVAVSGPSFAKEIMDRRPTSVVAAAQDPEAAVRVQGLLTSKYLRVAMSDDVVGVEVAGALKNVLAIAAGICEGLGLGLNAMSALVTQGNAEIRWLATAMGAKPETLSGLAGMGDILLTCFGSLSRNRRVGIRLGRGEPIDSILQSSGGVAEGVYTARIVVELADKYRVLLPVLTSVARILSNEVSPRQAVYEVMSLPPLPESA